jgi:hypothetical protein
MILRHATGSLVLLAAISASAPGFAQDRGVQRSFDGSTVHLTLSTGNYHIKASSEERIRVTPRTKSDDVSVRLNENFTGSTATVKVVGPKGGFDAVIEVPARVNLVIELAGGKLDVSGVVGSKDIAAKSAEIEVVVGPDDRYRQVSATVQKGNLTAPAFAGRAPERGSFEWTGPGEHDLRVRLDAGNVTLKN